MIPHGWCILWDRTLLAMHVVSDLVIALSYYVIPLILMSARRRLDSIIGRRALLLFASFIVLCGTTHVMEVVVIWTPAYLAQAWVKAATAAVSIGSAAYVVRLRSLL